MFSQQTNVFVRRFNPHISPPSTGAGSRPREKTVLQSFQRNPNTFRTIQREGNSNGRMEMIGMRIPTNREAEMEEQAKPTDKQSNDDWSSLSKSQPLN
jgi:hypothetical protein